MTTIDEEATEMLQGLDADMRLTVSVRDLAKLACAARRDGEMIALNTLCDIPVSDGRARMELAAFRTHLISKYGEGEGRIGPALRAIFEGQR